MFDQFGAKPAVLRCSRCGKFVDWDEAREARVDTIIALTKHEVSGFAGIPVRDEVRLEKRIE